MIANETSYVENRMLLDTPRSGVQFMLKCSFNAYNQIILSELLKTEQQLQRMKAIRTKLSKNLKHSSADVCLCLKTVQKA